LTSSAPTSTTIIPYWAQGAKAWTPPSFFHNHNPMSDIDDRSMAARFRWRASRTKPFVVREWNYLLAQSQPRRGHGRSRSYAALHDIDAMILFVYETRPTARVSYFQRAQRPDALGLCGVGAQIFLKGLYQAEPPSHCGAV
jgi:hypothetical protein